MIDTKQNLKHDFDTQGYTIARGLFPRSRVDELNAMAEEIHTTGAGGRYSHLSLEEAEGDVLQAYPRIMQPHRYNDTARAAMIDSGLADVLRELFEEEPLAVQSMYYFKPPGARGQAMHQDQFYLQVRPGTCIAAWIAMDYVDKENGGILVFPKTQNLDIDCSKVGKAGSYEKGAKPIKIPAGLKAESTEMEPGDALFFNGSLIHGSASNRSNDRWRRSFICHYVGVSCTTISESYHPLVDMTGRDVVREKTTDGGPCGAWVGAAH